MITKEDYQLLRLHPAFSALPVELFDKLAVAAMRSVAGFCL